MASNDGIGGLIGRGLDPTKATAARIYALQVNEEGAPDYFSFPADRAQADQLNRALPSAKPIARCNRAFLGRVVHHLAADIGYDQFLDLGSGIPILGNVHEIAQAANPQARTVYVDIDPVAVVTSTQLLGGDPQTIAIEGDLGDTNAILKRLDQPDARSVLDLDQPVVAIYVSSLHYAGDEVFDAVAALRDRLASGSALVVAHVVDTAYGDDETREGGLAVFRKTTTPVRMRRPAQIESFFGGWELLQPGLVWLPDWRPDAYQPEPYHGKPDPFADDPAGVGILGGVAVKP
ncbi:SAM-dependent methyltransferase [Micromonospora echinospora]